MEKQFSIQTSDKQQSCFVYQQSQYGGPITPCTLADFNQIVDSPDVAWRIGTRQQVENAIARGQPLDSFIADGKFQSFCQKHAAEPSFQALTVEQKLLQWTGSLKSGLPCFIFAAKGFKGTQRRLEDVILGPLFMLDCDHLPCKPVEIFQRTQVEGFLWQVALAHGTSSDFGLRLVCLSRPELGNLADNQICLARDLGIYDMMGTTGKPVVDDSCIDACRISYVPRRQDILYSNEQLLFGSEDDGEGDSRMEQLYGEQYRQGRGSCNPIHSENRFYDGKTAVAVETSNMSGQQPAQAEGKADMPMVFGHAVIDFLHVLLPFGAPVGSRHPWIVKLSNDLLILCDNDAAKVKEVLLSLQWVKDVVAMRGIQEVDRAIDSAQKLLHRRESEYLYTPQPSKEIRRAIEQVTKRKYKELVKEIQQQALGSFNGAQRDEIIGLLENIGKEIEKLFPYCQMLKLLCHRLPRKHYVAALFLGGAMLMTLMTRCWYKFWSAPGRKCRCNSLLYVNGRSGSGKHIAVEFYNLLMEPMKASDKAQIAALNKWNEEKDQNSGASKNSTARPKGIFRCLPPESSAASIREAESNAHEVIDGEDTYLHVFMFDSEFDNTLRQLKKSYVEQLFTVWLKSFHNENHGSYLKTSSAPVGEYPVHFNAVYTGTDDALRRLATEANFANGLEFRFTVVPMGDSNFEMMEAHVYDAQDALRDQQLRQWAYNLDKVKGEIPCKDISDALFKWTSMRMEDAKEEQSKALEDLVKRPCWHAINYALPFIVSRHWDQMVKDDDGYMKCGPGFVTDKIDRKLALLIAKAHLAFQKYFFLAIGEKVYDDQDVNAASNTNHHQRTLLAYRRLPTIFTAQDVDECFDYQGNRNSISSKIKRLRDDGLIQRIRSGEDKGKFRKLS